VEVITVGIADCQTSRNPEAQLVTWALGSCIAVAIHDPVAQVAGLLHVMMPDSSIDREKAARQPYMYADTGIPELFRAAYALGAVKKRLTVRLVGGAQVVDPNGIFNIGKRNYLACRKVLWNAGVLVQAEAVGGDMSRTVRMQVGSGRLICTASGGALEELGGPKKGDLCLFAS
jgi:chemotaxis protein CheD